MQEQGPGNLTHDFESTLTRFLQHHENTLKEVESFVSKAKEHFSSQEHFVKGVISALEGLSHSHPQAEPEPARVRNSAPQAARSVTSPQTAHKVLIVDDTEIHRVLMSHYFKGYPVELDFSNSGEDALKQTASKAFDLIVMDLQMKGMSGLEATRKMRELGVKTPVLAVSSESPSDSEKHEAQAAGCTHYSSKGLSRGSFTELVLGILEAR